MGDSSRCSSAIKDLEFEDQPPEESGWTSYFEDFERLNYQTENIIPTSYSYCSVSSSGGGGASWAAVTDHATPPPPPPNKLIRKKGRVDQKVSDFDDSLEDTATSPVSSPKMGSSIRQTRMKSRGRYDNRKGSPLGKGSPNYIHHDQEEASKEGHHETSNIDDEYADLQKRGLCLVPFSMFANYSR